MGALLSRDDIVCIVLDMLDTKIIIPKYAYKKPNSLFLDEYLIVNSLPPQVFNSYPENKFNKGSFVTRYIWLSGPCEIMISDFNEGDVVQSSRVNINYFVKDIAEGVPNISKLNVGADSIKKFLKKASTTSILVSFDGEELIREKKNHYLNLKFSFNYTSAHFKLDSIR